METDQQQPEQGAEHKKNDPPSSASAYLDPNYWNQRFSNEDHYEWFKDYSHFRHLVQSHVKTNSSVLELGCGNSQLCEELYKDGITDITCIDLSSIAVERMKEKLLSKGYKGSQELLPLDFVIQDLYGRKSLLIYVYIACQFELRESDLVLEIKVLEADMLDLPFSNESFDVVIEKGTMDVLFVDSGDPWNPQPATVAKVMAMLEGAHKVLKPDGIFISITFGQPHFRRPFFHNPKFTWSVEWSTFGDGFHYFFYILRKGRRTLNGDESTEKIERPSVSLYHEELEGEDYIFRTNVEELDC